MSRPTCCRVMLVMLCFVAFIGGCETTGSTRTAHMRGRLITPTMVYTNTRWTPDELSRDVAVRSMRVTRYASYHMIAVNKSEQPHVHDKHDVAVTLLSGRARLHLGLKTFELNPGDVVELPRGNLHWIENLGGAVPAEAFAVFSPPYQGRDKRLVNVPGW